jgi:hypothetical protein
MQLEWISYPITQYTLTGVGLISSLTLWASSKVEIRSVRRSMKNSLAELEKGVTNLNASMDDVRDDVRKANAAPPEPAPAPLPAPVPMPMPLTQALNLTRRTQIIRMKRRGENAQDIAAALQVPIGEVSLVLKMEQLQSGSLETSTQSGPRVTRGVL